MKPTTEHQAKGVSYLSSTENKLHQNRICLHCCRIFIACNAAYYVIPSQLIPVKRMNLTISAYNIDSHKLFMKPTMVMEKVDVSVETVNTKGGKQGDRMATKLGLWRPHQGARLQHHPCFPNLTDLWQEAYSTEDTVHLNLKKKNKMKKLLFRK